MKKNVLRLLTVAMLCVGFSSCMQHDKDDLEPRVEDPDNNNPQEDDPQGADGIEAIDLGLSVKWASCNIGATSPEDIGDYYAWGETSTKRSYTDSNWQNEGVFSGADIIDIIGTKYDVAHTKWGNGWRMPLKSEFQEMVDRCTYVVTTKNGAKVAKITGPNGNFIYMPLGGEIEDRTTISKGQAGYYWSGTKELNQPKCFIVDASYMWANVFLRHSYGANIRAVHE